MNKITFYYLEMIFEKIMNIKNSDELLNNKKHWHEHINYFSIVSIEAMLIKSNPRLINLNM